MFKSATFKLTTWYLAIIIVVSLLFSMAIYSVALREIGIRIAAIQAVSGYDRAFYEPLRVREIHQAEANLTLGLAVANISIWALGGVGSYYMARRTLEPIENAHEAQSRFVSDASHELRTPLASMKTELEVALRDPKLTKNEAKELLSSTLEEVDKLTQLSQTLLQMARLDAKAITYEKVFLISAIQSAVKRFGADGKRVKIARSLPPIIRANRLQIEELVTILVDNALKYSPAGSRITISFLKQKNFVGFAITNEGEGIPPAVLPHIFDRFYRAEKSRTGNDKKGYGLGLSLAKKIVEIHHGELSVSSAPGAPTTFRVLLPRFTHNSK